MQNNRYRRILLLFLCFLMLFICSCGKAPADVRIYNDIKECYAIEDQQYESIVIYSSPSEDKNIKGLTYEAFYGCEIKNSDFAFEFFAYQFYDSTSAQAYFSAVTGKHSDLTTNYSDVTGIATYRRIVIDQEKAYILYCDNTYANAAVAFLNSFFSKELCTFSQ